MKIRCQNEKGLTLVEILVAITILSIVLITFSSFFLQSAKHTNSNKEKLTAVQVAEDLVAKVRSGDYSIGSECEECSYDGFDFEIVDVTYEVPNLPDTLKKVRITVQSISKNASSFTTEIYYEEV